MFFGSLIMSNFIVGVMPNFIVYAKFYIYGQSCTVII